MTELEAVAVAMEVFSCNPGERHRFSIRFAPGLMAIDTFYLEIMDGEQVASYVRVYDDDDAQGLLTHLERERLRIQ